MRNDKRHLRHAARIVLLLLCMLSLFVWPEMLQAQTEINSCAELESISLDGNYIQGSDIDCDGVDFEPIGEDGDPFTGTYDGQNYVIENLTIEGSSQIKQGLFAVVGSAGELKRITLEGIHIDGSSDGEEVGGLVGENHGRIDTATVVIEAEDYIIGREHVGGLVGLNHEATIYSSLVEINSNEGVRDQLTGTIVGGLVGQQEGTVIKSFVTGTGSVTGRDRVGGLLGRNSGWGQDGGIVENSYTTVEVAAPDGSRVGGLIGDNRSIDEPVTHSYAAGAVTGNGEVGALVGNDDSTDDFVKSFWDYGATGLTEGVGDGDDAEYDIESFSTSEMTWDYDQWDPPNDPDGPYDNWDFDNIWAHDEDGTLNDGYPVLQFQTVAEPAITITSPDDGYETSAETIDVTGEGEEAEEGDLVAVVVNGADTQEVALDAELEWEVTDVGLEMGENTITAKLYEDDVGSEVVDEETITVHRVSQVEFAGSRLMADGVVIASALDGTGTNDDRIMLYNPTTSDVDLSDFWIARYTSTRSSWTDVTGKAEIGTLTDETGSNYIIEAGGWFLIGRTDVIERDVTWDENIGSDYAIGLFPQDPENYSNSSEAYEDRLDAIGFDDHPELYEEVPTSVSASSGDDPHRLPETVPGAFIDRDINDSDVISNAGKSTTKNTNSDTVLPVFDIDAPTYVELGEPFEVTVSAVVETVDGIQPDSVVTDYTGDSAWVEIFIDEGDISPEESDNFTDGSVTQDWTITGDPGTRTVEVADLASVGSIEFEVVEDMPEISITYPEDGIDTWAEHITVSGTTADADPGDSITVYVDTSQEDTVKVAGDGTWSASVSLVEGGNIIEARLKESDPASETMDDDTISVTRILPEIYITSPEHQHDTNVETITVEGTTPEVMEGVNVQVSLDGADTSTTSVDSAGEWDVSLSGLSSLDQQVKALVYEGTTNDPVGDTDTIIVNFNDTNLLHIYNWDFYHPEPQDSDNPRDWQIEGTEGSVNRTSTRYLSRGYSLVLEGISGTYGWREIYSAPMEIDTGLAYGVSGDFYVPDEGEPEEDVDIALELHWYENIDDPVDDPISESGLVDVNVSAFDTWEQLTSSGLDPPENAGYARVYLSAKEDDSNIDHDVFADQIEVTERATIDITVPIDQHDTDVTPITVSGQTTSSEEDNEVEVYVDGSLENTGSVEADGSWSVSDVELTGMGQVVEARLYDAASGGSVVDTDAIIVNYNDTNLLHIYNWDFYWEDPQEAGMAEYWENRGDDVNVSRSDAESRSRGWSMELANLNAGFGDRDVVSETVPVYSDTMYKVSGWFYVDDDDGGAIEEVEINLQIEFYEDDSTYIESKGLTAATISGYRQWEQLVADPAIVPTDAAKARVVVDPREIEDENRDVYVDMVEMVEEPRRSIEITRPEVGYETTVEAITVSGTTAEASEGDSVVILVEGSAQDTVAVGADDSWSGDVTLAEGDNEIEVRLKYSDPYSSTMDTDSITVTYTPAEIVITDPEHHHDTNVTDITVSGTAPAEFEGDSVQVTLDGTNQFTTKVSGAGSWSGQVSGLASLDQKVEAFLYEGATSEPVADTDLIFVNYSDTNLLHIYNWDMYWEGPDEGGPEDVLYWRIPPERVGTDAHEEAITHSDAQSYRRGYSMSIDNLTGSPSSRNVLSEPVPVNEENTYELSLRYLLDESSGDTAAVDIEIQWLDSGQDILEETVFEGYELDPDAGWEQIVTGACEPPAGVEYARINIDPYHDDGGGDQTYWDTVEFYEIPTITITYPEDGLTTDAISIDVGGDVCHGADIGDSIVLEVNDIEQDPVAVQSDYTWEVQDVPLDDGENTIIAYLKESGPETETVDTDVITVHKVDYAELVLTEVSPFGDGLDDDWVEVYVIESGHIPEGIHLYEPRNDRTLPLDQIVVEVTAGDYILARDDADGTSDTDSMSSGSGDYHADDRWDLYRDGAFGITGGENAVAIRDADNEILDGVVWSDAEADDFEIQAVEDFAEEMHDAGQWELEAEELLPIETVYNADGDTRIYYRESSYSDTTSRYSWDYQPKTPTPGAANDTEYFQWQAGSGTASIAPQAIEPGSDAHRIEVTYTAEYDFGDLSQRGFVVLTIPAGYPHPDFDDSTAPGHLEIEADAGKQNKGKYVTKAGDTVVWVSLGHHYDAGERVQFTYGAEAAGVQVPEGTASDTFTLRSSPRGNMFREIDEQPVLERAPPDEVIVGPSTKEVPAGATADFYGWAELDAGYGVAGSQLKYEVVSTPTGATDYGMVDTSPVDGRTDTQGEVKYSFQTDPDAPGEYEVEIYYAEDEAKADSITINALEHARLVLNEVSPLGDALSADWVELRVVEPGVIGPAHHLKSDGNTIPLDVIVGQLEEDDYIVVMDTAGTSDTDSTSSGSGDDHSDQYWNIYDSALSMAGGSDDFVFYRDAAEEILDALIWAHPQEELETDIEDALNEAVAAGQWDTIVSEPHPMEAVSRLGDDTGVRTYYRHTDLRDTDSRFGWDFLPAEATPGEANDDSKFNVGTGSGQTSWQPAVVTAGAEGVSFQIDYVAEHNFGVDGRRGYITVQIPSDLPEPTVTDETAPGYVSIESPPESVNDSGVIELDNGDALVYFVMRASGITGHGFEVDDQATIIYGSKTGGGPGFELPAGEETVEFLVSSDPTGNNFELLSPEDQPELLRSEPDSLEVTPKSTTTFAGDSATFSGVVRDDEGNRLFGDELGYEVLEEPEDAEGEVVSQTPEDGITGIDGAVHYTFVTDPEITGDYVVEVYRVDASDVSDTIIITTTDPEPVDLATSRLIAEDIVIAGVGRDEDDNEWVMLYNPTTEDVELENYWFARYAGTNWDAPIREEQFPDGETIKSGGYYLIVREEDDVPGADFYWDGPLVADGNGFGLFPQPPGSFDDAQEVSDMRVDAVGFAEVGHVYESDTVPEDPHGPDHYSLRRPENIEGSFIDRDINSLDWVQGDIKELTQKNTAADTAIPRFNIQGPAEVDEGETFTVDADLIIKTLEGLQTGEVVQDYDGDSAYAEVFVSEGEIQPDVTLSFNEGELSAQELSIHDIGGTVTITFIDGAAIGELEIFVVDNIPPTVDLLYPDTGAYVSGDVPGTYVISDPDVEDEFGTTYVEYSPDGGATWEEATIVDPSELESVSMSPEGDTHGFEWDSEEDIGTDTINENVKLRIRGYDGTEWGDWDTSPYFTVDTIRPPPVDEIGSKARVADPDTGVEVQWTYTDTDVYQFNIYRNSTVDTETADKIDTVAFTSESDSYFDDTVNRGDTYFYWVVTEDTGGNTGDFSPETTAPYIELTKNYNSEDSFRPGESFHYEIEYVNSGFGPTNELIVEDRMPNSTYLADTAGYTVTFGPEPEILYLYDDEYHMTYDSAAVSVRWKFDEPLDPQTPGETAGTLTFEAKIQ